MLCYVISCSVLVERTRSSEYPSNYSTERLNAKKRLIFLQTRLNSAVECGYLNREQRRLSCTAAVVGRRILTDIGVYENIKYMGKIRYQRRGTGRKNKSCVHRPSTVRSRQHIYWQWRSVVGDMKTTKDDFDRPGCLQRATCVCSSIITNRQCRVFSPVAGNGKQYQLGQSIKIQSRLGVNYKRKNSPTAVTTSLHGADLFGLGALLTR